MSDDARLKARVEARQEANAIIELAHEASCRLLNNSLGSTLRTDATDVFWQEIRDASLVMTPLPPVEPKLIKARPMTDTESREFEKEICPFGQYATQRMSAVPLDYLKWLSDQTFIDDLRRYLANDMIMRQ